MVTQQIEKKIYLSKRIIFRLAALIGNEGKRRNTYKNKTKEINGDENKEWRK